jgi:predicted RNA-binding protein with PIN domain
MSEPTPDAVPDAVRAAVLPLAAEVLGTLDAAAVPASLAAVRRFAPRRRAAAGAGPLWLAVERDDAFRARVARAWSHAHPELAADLLADPPGAATPGDRLALAVGAVLLRPDGWVARVSALDPREAAPDDEPVTSDAPVDLPAVPDDTHRANRAEAEVRRLAARLAAETERADAAEAELGTLRKDARRLRADADRARAEARRAAEHAAEVAAAAERVHAETALVRARADEDRRRADEVARTARQDASALRELDEVRVRLLLDTVVEAGAALRAELALPPVSRMPADLVAPAPADAAPGPRPTSRGRGADDPALLDDLLRMPRAHLVVDGYNVSKLAWPDQSLAEQRRRLTERLANLAGRTGAEVTCCFDGQEADPAARTPAGPRGVRVLFSAGEIADDLIRRLVRAEPTGRVVVVVTSDRALGADTEAAGARVLPSPTLLARLGRV